MEPVRMSLSDASAVLGIAINSVRSRWKSGKIRGERDNSGKVWVWITPPNDVRQKVPSKHSVEPSNSGEVEALRAHIATLSEQLDRAQADRDELLEKSAEADRLAGQIHGLEAVIEHSKAAQEAAEADRDRWIEEAQRLAARRWWKFGRT